MHGCFAAGGYTQAKTAPRWREAANDIFFFFVFFLRTWGCEAIEAVADGGRMRRVRLLEKVCTVMWR